ncbi:hypothetical protein GGX14DRAFT_607865 [Mycena pura]|uniref:Uncharacterized protein n=1 Tax=Mycena pura TaxID=153505 RepID=A0AAD6ULC8_9AGAR|nr:hypothetical protein GGX14DRAFT_607865 [Mycena pura]
MADVTSFERNAATAAIMDAVHLRCVHKFIQHSAFSTQNTLPQFHALQQGHSPSVHNGLYGRTTEQLPGEITDDQMDEVSNCIKKMDAFWGLQSKDGPTEVTSQEEVSGLREEVHTITQEIHGLLEEFHILNSHSDNAGLSPAVPPPDPPRARPEGSTPPLDTQPLATWDRSLGQAYKDISVEELKENGVNNYFCDDVVVESTCSIPTPSVNAASGASQARDALNAAYAIAMPSPIRKTAARSALAAENDQLRALLKAAGVELDRNYAQMVLMERENINIRTQLHAKKNKRKRTYTTCKARLITSVETRQALLDDLHKKQMGELHAELKKKFFPAIKKAIGDAEKAAKASTKRAEQQKKAAAKAAERTRKTAEKETAKAVARARGRGRGGRGTLEE